MSYTSPIQHCNYLTEINTRKSTEENQFTYWLEIIDSTAWIKQIAVSHPNPTSEVQKREMYCLMDLVTLLE